MSDIHEYYRHYHKDGGHYCLAWTKGSSRHLMIQDWLRANLKPGDKVLDVGCGDGSYSEWMPEFQWFGMDINQEKTKYNGTRVAHDLESVPYPYPDASFDAVICSEVLEHLFTPEKAHSEAHRVLKPKGVYLISTPNFNWVEHMLQGWTQILYNPKGATHTKEHIRFYTPETHIAMLFEHGFRVTDFMGADVQFGEFFQMARTELKKVMPDKEDGEIDNLIGKMFRTVCHTIGILSVKP